MRLAAKPAMRLPAVLVASAISFTASGAGTPVPSARQDLADLSLEQLSNLVVTSVSRREERLADAPASIYVITAQEIRGSGATTLPEALRLAPNLNVARADAVQYAITARGFNNVLANKMLVLIDGRTVYTPLFSGVFWEAQDVLIEDIERIEVISGPGATLWGANAVNGVINVITRSARDTQGPMAYFGHGNRETSGAARFGGEVAGGHYRIYAKSSDRASSELENGSDVRDSAQMQQAGFRMDWGGAQRSFTFQGDTYAGTVDQVGPSREISGGNLLARYGRQLEGGGSIRLQAYYDRTDRYHPRMFKETRDTYDAEFQHGFKVAAHNLVWGAGHRESRDEIDNSPSQAFLPDRKTLTWTNLFAQDQIGLRHDLDLTLGAKAERNSYTGTEFLPSARVAWRIAADRLAWGALSRAVRAPSRLDREVFFPGQPPFQLTAGDFMSEVANVAELGYRAQPSKSFSYSVTLFHHEYDRLRSVGLLDGKPVFANDLEGSSSGLEAWARWQATPAIAFSGGFVSIHQSINVKSGGLDLGGRASLGNDPERWGKLRATWAVTPRHDLDIALRHYGPLAAGGVPAYTAVDARLGWKVMPAIELSLALQNLTDDKHIEWGNRVAQPRSAFLKVTWRP
jgi:iron complex outermembrane receptor protein